MTQETRLSFEYVVQQVALIAFLCIGVLGTLVLVAYGILAVLVFRPHKSAPSYYMNCTDIPCRYANNAGSSLYRPYTAS